MSLCFTILTERPLVSVSGFVLFILRLDPWGGGEVFKGAILYLCEISGPYSLWCGCDRVVFWAPLFFRQILQTKCFTPLPPSCVLYLVQSHLELFIYVCVECEI